MEEERTENLCPYCQAPVPGGLPVTNCPVCGTPHHAECWHENGGCAVYGCTGRVDDSAQGGRRHSAPPSHPSTPRSSAGPPRVAPAVSRRDWLPWLIPPLLAFGLALLISRGTSCRHRKRSSPLPALTAPSRPTPTPTLVPITVVTVLIPESRFTMGSKAGRPDEHPLHRVELRSYRIGRYEVTNEQYGAFVARANVSPPPSLSNPVLNDPKAPVVGVTWHEAMRFCRWMTSQHGKGYSLPTEAQWEYAARGKHNRSYPWGNSLGPREGHRCNRGGELDSFPYTAAVGRFPAGISPHKLYDCAGNAAEWCRDWYSSDYYAVAPMTEPDGPPTGRFKVVRGGSWETMALEDLRCTARSKAPPDIRLKAVGFRVVCEP